MRRYSNPLDEILRRLENLYLADSDPMVYAKILAERIRVGIPVDQGVPPSEVDSYKLLIEARVRTGVTTQPRVVMAARLGHEAARLAAPEWVESREINWDNWHRKEKTIATLGYRRMIVSFACDCVERVLPNFERYVPGDMRPRFAIEAIRAWVLDPSAKNKIVVVAISDSFYSNDDERGRYSADYATFFVAHAVANPAIYAAHYAVVAINNAAIINDGNPDDADSNAERLWQRQCLAKYLLGEIKLPPISTSRRNSDRDIRTLERLGDESYTQAHLLRDLSWRQG